MSIVYYCQWPNSNEWLSHLRTALPGETIEVWPDVKDLDAIEIALVWASPPDLLARMKNLKIVLSLGAGVDHIVQDKEMPTDVTIGRLIDPLMADRMAEYVAGQVLRHHLQFDTYRRQAIDASWLRHPPRDAGNVTTTILGLGNLGQRCAEYLAALGFRSTGWSRSAKTIDRVECFAGPEGLRDVLSQCNHLVCLLPLTSETRNILNRDTFGLLPPGAQIMNCARGDHLSDKDLLAALDSGHLSEAVIDVFRQEPLDPAHPFWQHENIVVTPHISCLSEPTTGAKILADQITSFRAGENLADQVILANEY